MNRLFTLLGSVAAGAVLMYLFDPKEGERRREMIRDKAVGLSNDLTDGVTTTSRDLRNRAEGVMHEVKKLTSGPQQQTADTLTNDVRGL